jgi:radical SAM protein with 4Fe4S-binding SPASM domain
MIENSKTFCMFPWVHLSVQPDGEVLPCCNSSPLGLSLSGSSLYEVWNSQKIKNLRLNMLNNVKSSNCRHCYAVEDVGQESPRQLINRKYSHHFDIVKTTKNDGTVNKLNVVYWDFRFSNFCNFKCRMCGL